MARRGEASDFILAASSASAFEGIAGMWRTASGGLGQTAFSSCSAISVVVEFTLRSNEHS
jgi:hypothetical protein